MTIADSTTREMENGRRDCMNLGGLRYIIDMPRLAGISVLRDCDNTLAESCPNDRFQNPDHTGIPDAAMRLS
jgi:hypothetical protein